MIDLDSLKIYQQSDPAGMLKHLHNFPEQCNRAWQNALGFDLPQSYSQVKKVIILGMGGSAIGGDLVRRLALLENRLPVWIHRDYAAPPFLDRDTLLIASSYSGNTEETLDAFTKSLKSPAKKLAITTGGKLKDIAIKEGIPVFIIDYQSPPRAALPHSFFTLLGIFQKLGLLRDKSTDLVEALEVMKVISDKTIESTPLASNPAKQLASRMSGKIPVIYGAEMLTEVAQRWKGQINENSKSWSFYEVFSELNHNAVLGYDFPAELKERMLVVFLHSSLLNLRISARYRLTAEILSKSGIAFQVIETSGKSPMAQMMSTVLYGDYVSYYLALLNGVDPSSIVSIDYLKARLAEL